VAIEPITLYEFIDPRAGAYFVVTSQRFLRAGRHGW
jgi:hypothetical protein